MINEKRWWVEKHFDINLNVIHLIYAYFIHNTYNNWYNDANFYVGLRSTFVRRFFILKIDAKIKQTKKTPCFVLKWNKLNAKIRQIEQMES